MTIFIDRNKNTIHPMKDAQAIGSINQSPMI
jgi:hypothetical protein